MTAALPRDCHSHHIIEASQLGNVQPKQIQSVIPPPPKQRPAAPMERPYLTSTPAYSHAKPKKTPLTNVPPHRIVVEHSANISITRKGGGGKFEYRLVILILVSFLSEPASAVPNDGPNAS